MEHGYSIFPIVAHSNNASMWADRRGVNEPFTAPIPYTLPMCRSTYAMQQTAYAVSDGCLSTHVPVSVRRADEKSSGSPQSMMQSTTIVFSIQHQSLSGRLVAILPYFSHLMSALLFMIFLPFNLVALPVAHCPCQSGGHCQLGIEGHVSSPASQAHTDVRI